jgi:hypothetical protein
MESSYSDPDIHHISPWDRRGAGSEEWVAPSTADAGYTWGGLVEGLCVEVQYIHVQDVQVFRIHDATHRFWTQKDKPTWDQIGDTELSCLATEFHPSSRPSRNPFHHATASSLPERKGLEKRKP